ncbi:MAG: YdcF family protein [Ignavibacteria bacterium]
MLIAEAAAFGLLYYLRYKNQNLPLNGFEYKTGNIISLIFFLLLFILISTFTVYPKNFNGGVLLFLLFISIIGFISIAVTGLTSQKEIRIIFAGIFLVSNVYLLSFLLGKFLSGSRKFGFMRSTFFFLFILSASIFTVFILILNYNDDYESYTNTNKTASSGVILGAAVWGGNRPSPVLKERINKGFEIYQKKIVPKLVITGGGSPNEMTEGEVSKNVLIKYGVSPEDLILENSSSSTVEQIQFVRDSLYNVKNWNKVILISDNFHLLRASEIGRFNNISTDTVASDFELSTAGTISYCMKESLALIIFWMCGIG